jgi:hypothetical protein
MIELSPLTALDAPTREKQSRLLELGPAGSSPTVCGSMEVKPFEQHFDALNGPRRSPSTH